MFDDRTALVEGDHANVLTVGRALAGDCHLEIPAADQAISGLGQRKAGKQSNNAENGKYARDFGEPYQLVASWMKIL